MLASNIAVCKGAFSRSFYVLDSNYYSHILRINFVVYSQISIFVAN